MPNFVHKMLLRTVQVRCCHPQLQWRQLRSAAPTKRNPSYLQGRMCSKASAINDRSTHNQKQHEIFNAPHEVSFFTNPLPAEIEERLQRIAQAVPDLGPGSRVIDVGSGTGCLIPHFQARGVQDILAVDLCEEMLKELSKRYCKVGVLGNDIGVRTWCGDVVDLPNYQGPADAFFMNGVFGNLFSPRDALLRAALMLRPGGHIVISHPLGRTWHRGLHEQNPSMVPHELPSREALEKMVWDLPLRVVEMVDEQDLYLACLQVPPRYALPQGALYLDGPVVTGFGRGSRQMGVPTANIDPVPLAAKLEGLPKGVYFGWACLDAPDSWPDADRAVHKMVMNIGQRPTVSGDGETAVTVEAHIMHKFSGDFYGRRLRVVALGYVRPEMRFAGGIGELITRIKADVAISRIMLDEAELAAHQNDSFLRS